MNLPKIHFLHQALLNPMNPVSVSLVGAGGTGSHVLACLARINYALTAMGKAGLRVTVFDPDIIEPPNLARGLFSEHYLGIAKAVAVVGQINRCYGLNWKAVPESYFPMEGELVEGRMTNITICCVDSAEARFKINTMLKGMAKQTGAVHRDHPYYVMDFGNQRDSGQVILSTVGSLTQPVSEKFSPADSLPMITEEFGELLNTAENADDQPSCSLFDALSKQNLLINSSLANLGCTLLYRLLSEGFVESRGFFVNLETFRLEPLAL